MTDHYDLEAQLLPEQLRRLLASAATIIATDRLLRAAIVDRLLTFLSDTLDEPPPAPVPSADDAELDERLTEMVSNGFLDSDDAIVVRALRAHAVELCARMPDLVLGSHGGIQLGLLDDAERVLRKVSVAWARISTDCDPDFDGLDIADEDIKTGPSMLLRELRQAALLV